MLIQKPGHVRDIALVITRGPTLVLLVLLHIPLVLSDVCVQWKHRVVPWRLRAFQGKVKADSLMSGAKSFLAIIMKSGKLSAMVLNLDSGHRYHG